MELFMAAKIGDTEGASIRKCAKCGRVMELIRAVHFPDRQAVIRSFQCNCGERTWDE
jgi:hypothetical protein